MNKLTSTTAFTYIALYWIAFGASAFVSALGGFFAPTFFFFFLLAGVFLLLSTRTDSLRAALAPLLPAAGIVLALTILWSIFATPTVFTGRDQGSIATAAIMLAETHTLQTHTPISDAFFAYYGAGRALNFPGFFYTADGALTTQFPIPYIAWLAAFYGIFGLFGFTLANTILFVLFTLSLLLLTQHIAQSITHKKSTPKRATQFTLLFTLTSFPLMWFFGHTLSENLAQFLIFFLLLQALLFVHHVVQKSPRFILYLHFWSAVATGILLTFTRIEGIVLFALMLFGFLIHPRTNDELRTRMVSHLLAPAIAVLFGLAIVFDKTTNFYKMIAKALLPSGTTAGSAGTFSFVGDIISRYTDYLSYGILPFIVVGAYSAYILWKKKHYYALLPLFITAPIFIYLIDPHISTDAPWMLRRVTFAILPLGILYSTLFILQQKHRAAKILTTALLVLALPAYITFFFFSENDHLLQQTQALGAQFAQHDAILIDASVSGNGFALLAGPLQVIDHKNAAYIFNPEDVLRVDFSQFRNVFLITSTSTANRYIDAIGARLTQRTNTSITTTRLTRPEHTTLWDFPHRDTVTTESIIFHVTQ